MQPSDLHAWTAVGNQQANEAAKQVHFRHDYVFELYHAAQVAFTSVAHLAQQVASLQVSILEVATSCKKPENVLVQQPTDAAESFCLGLRWDISWPAPQVFEDTVLSPSFLYKLQEFFPTKEWFQSATCVSMAELYFAFV